MAVQIQPISPIASASGIILTSEIVVRVFEDTNAALNNVAVSLTDDKTNGQVFDFTPPNTILNFSNFTSEVVDNNPGTDSDFTFVIIRPINDSKFSTGQQVIIDVTAT